MAQSVSAASTSSSFSALSSMPCIENNTNEVLALGHRYRLSGHHQRGSLLVIRYAAKQTERQLSKHSAGLFPRESNQAMKPE